LRTAYHFSLNAKCTPRRAARKFEVYMRKQGRTVHFDGRGKQIDDDRDDKKRWN
jgi:hypothetical protein